MSSRAQIPMRIAGPSRHVTPSDRGILQRKCACGGSENSSGECADCKKKLQRRSDGAGAPTAVPPIVNDVLRSPGRPLDSVTERLMATRFSFLSDQPLKSMARGASPATLTVNQPGDRYEREADRVADQVMRYAGSAPVPAEGGFRDVRVHTDARAAQSARSVGVHGGKRRGVWPRTICAAHEHWPVKYGNTRCKCT